MQNFNSFEGPINKKRVKYDLHIDSNTIKPKLLLIKATSHAKLNPTRKSLGNLPRLGSSHGQVDFIEENVTVNLKYTIIVEEKLWAILELLRKNMTDKIICDEF